MTSVVYIGKEAKIACTHEMAGMFYIFHGYNKLYLWVLRGVLMNSEQLRLLV